MDSIRIAASPVTYIGWGALKNLGDEVERYGNGPVLIIADPVIQSLGLVEKIAAPLRKTGRQVTVYTDIIPEPLLQTAEELVRFARQGHYALVMGIGGGSALDMAKLAAVLIRNPGPVKDYLNLTGTKAVTNRGIPKILIPTTAGTGTEVTNISVVALEQTKDVVVHDHLIADTAIVDPELTVTVPPAVTAATGADALTHALEAYLSVNANPYSDGLALQAIKLTGGSLVAATEDGTDTRARTHMMYGSYLAGLAFFSAGVGAVHALAYPLGGQFHIAHGASNAVLLPYVLDHIRSSCAGRLGTILQTLGDDTVYGSEAEAAFKCVRWLKELMQRIGIPATLGGYQIPETALRSLAEDGIQQKRLLARCPMSLSHEDVYRIYEKAFRGSFADQA
ncbi:iron-containing alcohol dehydrogenase [Niabella aurantiaca]|uniref:iron-containing alcohol dehydrogenase n=1 Tax=Niabella aurantiaca TaxID=379900 RepID=UPI000377CEFE|nr:iron-containing alcohol dehydrogenase [Niabella aurantiaca]